MQNQNPSKNLSIAMLGHKETVALGNYRGGIETVVENISTRMVSRGNRVCCYDRYYKNGSRLKQYQGVTIKRSPAIQKKGLAAVSSSFFATLSATLGSYDVVHIHAEGPALFSFIPAFFNLFRRKKQRIICHNHGLDWARACWDGGFASKYIKWGERASVRFSHELIVLSPHLQQYFKDTYGRDTVLVPNGISPPVVQPASRITSRFGLERNEYILFTGRLVPEKGLLPLVEAFRQVKTNKKLVIAGDLSQQDSYIQTLQHEALRDDRVVLAGFVSGVVLQELYSNAFLYVQPSELEGMPLSLLEAMSYGNRCLVSDIPECAGVVLDQGVQFRVGDTGDLAEKLQNICNAPSLTEEERVQISSFICHRHSWEDTVDQLLALYRGETP